MFPSFLFGKNIKITVGLPWRRKQKERQRNKDWGHTWPAINDLWRNFDKPTSSSSSPLPLLARVCLIETSMFFFCFILSRVLISHYDPTKFFQKFVLTPDCPNQTKPWISIKWDQLHESSRVGYDPQRVWAKKIGKKATLLMHQTLKFN